MQASWNGVEWRGSGCCEDGLLSLVTVAWHGSGCYNGVGGGVSWRLWLVVAAGIDFTVAFVSRSWGRGRGPGCVVRRWG